MRGALSVLCAAKLHKNQLERHLELFEYIPEVKRVIVVRREPLDTRLSKLENYPIAPSGVAREIWNMTRTVARVIEQERIDWVVGFNPVPWGSVALGAAKAKGVPSCLSLIGMDFLQLQRLWGWPFLQAVRSAEAVTVTGASMQRRLVQMGVSESKITVLPHSVDLARFAPGQSEPVWDVVSVGQLIKRKRMDVLIRAVAQLRDRGVSVRLAILGTGPEEGALRSLAAQLGVDAQVSFLGYRDDVEAVLRQARVFALVSAWEGVPFALMEAMACGLVPVVTRVGTIEDWVTSGKSGLLVEVDQVEETSHALEQALSARGDDMRSHVLSERGRLSLEHGAQVWREILGL